VMSFFFQAEDGIRDATVTGVQTCALPILPVVDLHLIGLLGPDIERGPEALAAMPLGHPRQVRPADQIVLPVAPTLDLAVHVGEQIGRASCREREYISVGSIIVDRKMMSRR